MPDTKPKWLIILEDFLERAFWTAGQQFFSVLLGVAATVTATQTTVVDLPWKLACATALGAAVVSLGTTAVQYLTKLTPKAEGHFWFDLAVRLAKTFISSLLGSMAGVKVFDVRDFDWQNAFELAVIATLTALGKCFLARGPGSADNGSTMSGKTFAQINP